MKRSFEGSPGAAQPESAIRDRTPVTPSKPSNLVIPLLSAFERRASPRAEEMLAKKYRKPGKAQATRMRLEQFQTFVDAVKLLQTARNIVVLTGAGISTAVGIPDFRSDKGLYHRLSKDLGITTAEEFFSKQYFAENTEEFFKYVRGVIPDVFLTQDGTYKFVGSKNKSATSGQPAYVPEYSRTHAFLALLHSHGKLLTNYSQNIDGLELAAGLPPSKFIQCHGSWDTASCMTCGKTYAAKKYLAVVFDNNKPMCKCSQEDIPKPAKRRKTKAGQKRKRRTETDWGSDHSSDAFDTVHLPRGLLKPNITFFEDPIDPRYHERLDSDKTQMDLLIIIGTSLKVAPVQTMLYKIPAKVPQIYISKERFSGALCSLPGVQVDIELLGDADLIIGELCRQAGWTADLSQWVWRKKMTKPNNSESPNKEPGISIHGDNQVNNIVRTGGLQLKSSLQNDTNNVRHIHDGASELEDDKSIPGLALSAAANMEMLGDQRRVKIELEEGTSHRWRITTK